MKAVESISWKGRNATRLSNGIVELTALKEGGHLAELRFQEREGCPAFNVLWETPWATQDPVQGSGEGFSPIYGPQEDRRFLSSYTGHALCLDYFGAPSAEQAARGLSLHGEAAIMPWNVAQCGNSRSACCRWEVSLPSAGLTFEREIQLGDEESVAYVHESVTNENSSAHAFDWVQHVAFGPPLIQPGESTFIASANRGITAPSDYIRGSLLAKNREFSWPYAPRADGNAFVDLRQPFVEKGRGFIAGVQLDPERELEYLLAVNWKLSLGVGYLFRRQDFPWMTTWEENYAREDTPWNKRTQARGMEFGTCPLPLGREETIRRGPIFNTPHQCVISASGQKTARYLIFLFCIPKGVDSIEDVNAVENRIVLSDQTNTAAISVKATHCKSFLSQN